MASPIHSPSGGASNGLPNIQMNAVLSEAYYQIVCEEHGIDDPEALKEKLAAKL